MKNTRLALVVALVIFAVSAPLLAHHGAAGYDNEKMTILKATITDFIWMNPHCEVRFDAVDDKGTVQHWAIEAPPPTMLVERGWNRKSLKAGDAVTMHFNAAKNGSTSGIMRKAVMANGQDRGHIPRQKSWRN